MVAVRSNKEMELTPALTPIAPYKSQTGRWKRGIIPHCMNDPQTEGHMAKLHRTAKILSHARRRGGSVAARGARAAVQPDAAGRRADGPYRERSGGTVSHY